MSRKYYRFFGGLLCAQEKWLNKMSEKGFRLIKTGKMLYEFEECKPEQVKYRVEFIGQKSRDNAEDYRKFLEDMGYMVFYKNINLNFSLLKLRLRPWAEKAVVSQQISRHITVSCLLWKRKMTADHLNSIHHMRTEKTITAIYVIRGYLY